MATQAHFLVEKSRRVGLGWVEQRHARIASAIRFLSSRGILVSVVDRDAQVREYFVSGKRHRYLAEHVIDLAVAKGWAE